MAEPSDLASEVRLAVVKTPPKSQSEARKQDSIRRVEALSLRLAGLSYAQIAERLDTTKAAAEDMVTRTLSRVENRAADEMRELEGSRLDRAQAAIWTKVLDGDLRAVATFLRLSERRAVLFGLNAPTKISLNVTVRQEMEAALVALEKVVLGEVTSTRVLDPSE